MKREIINNAGASAGKLTIGNQTFRIVLQPMAKEPRQTKQAAAKPAAPAKPKAKPIPFSIECLRSLEIDSYKYKNM